MRNLIVSTMATLDGVYGDPQSWAGEFHPGKRVKVRLMSVTERLNGVVVLTYGKE